MKFSFIVPVYNGESYLSECIESILNQTYSNLELILVNDGSIDNSLEICESYLKKDNRVKLINQSNSGVSAARNNGLKETTGEWILFVDADDICHEELLINVKDELSLDSLLVFGYNKKFIDKKITFCENSNFEINENISRKLFMNQNLSGYLWNKVFSSNVIKNNELQFDKNFHFCEDMVFVSQYISLINKIKYINKDLYDYRQRKSSVSNQLINKKNASILFSYEFLAKKYKDDSKLFLFFCYRYILCYYKFRKFVDKSDVEFSLLKYEKDILKQKGMKEKVKHYMIKYFYKFYARRKNVKNYDVLSLFD